MLIGVFDPSDFDVTSAIPANSTTARTAPPAALQPSIAGFSNTRAPPNAMLLRVGADFQQNFDQVFLASSTALRIASGTS